MAKRKVGTSPAATAATLANSTTQVGTSRAEIEGALDDVARHFLESFGRKKAIPGWHILFKGPVSYLQLGQTEIKTLTEERASELVKLAETDAHAFDAASYLAGMHFGTGHLAAATDCPSALRIFGGQVLCGEIRRPVKRGRKWVDDAPLRAAQYGLCCFVAKRAPLPLTRNREPSGPPSFTACDAVAEAFTRAGSRTTYDLMAQLCSDRAHSKIRHLAYALGLLENSDI
jgi:hypothetical protein